MVLNQNKKDHLQRKWTKTSSQISDLSKTHRVNAVFQPPLRVFNRVREEASNLHFSISAKRITTVLCSHLTNNQTKAIKVDEKA